MTTRFNRILFDYDGTLIIHDKQKQSKRIAEMLKISEEKMPVFVERLDELFTTSYGSHLYKGKKITYPLFCKCVEGVMGPLREFGITVDDLNRAIDKNVKYNSQIAPYAKEVLEYLKNRGYQLCAFTNGFHYYQVGNMKHNDFYQYFDRVYAWDNYYAKPDMRAFERALGGTDPEKNVMIGDNIQADILPAKESGMYAIGYNIGSDQKCLVMPDVYITDLRQLKNIL